MGKVLIDGGLKMKDLLKLANRMRRKIMLSIDKDYVKKKLAKRRGNCLKCGQCCHGCEFWDEKTGLCNVYDSRPSFCHRDFPIDRLDQKVFGVEDCGYKFNE